MAKNKKGKKHSAHIPKEAKKEVVSTIKEAPINYVLGLIIALFAFALFANTVGHDYVLDDSGAINENLYVLEGISGIPKLMTVEFWHFSNIHLGYYRPLSLITFAIENEFVKTNPHVSHFINVLLFALSGFILFILLSKVFKSKHCAFPFFVTLLFVAHPIHTEIVANIKGRDEILSFLNSVLMLWFSLKYIDTKKVIHLIASLIFCYLAMLSKETALIGVVLLPLFIYYYTNKTIPNAIKQSLGCFIVVALFFIQKNNLLDVPTTVPTDIVNYPYTQNAVKWPTVFMLFTMSLGLLTIPFNLRYDYSYNHIPGADFSNPWAIIGILLFTVGAFYTYKEVLKKSTLGLALAIFYIALIPALAFTILRGGIFAERFLFVPTLGFCISLVFGASCLLKTNLKPSDISLQKFIGSNIPISAILVLICAIYSVKTVSRNSVWKDNFTLFSTDIKTGQNSAQNHRHLGNECIKLASVETDSVKKAVLTQQALKAFRDALRIHPKFGEIYQMLGVTYQNIIPNNDSAIYYYNQAIKYAPGYAVPRYNMGIIYHSMGQYNVASFYYNEAVKYNPQMVSAQNASNMLKKQGFDIHINPLKSVVDLNSKNKNSSYYFNEGNYYAAQSNYEKAINSYLKSLEQDNTKENVKINLANCYGMLKQYDKGIAVATQILKVNPNSKLALNNLAITYNIIGNKKMAQTYRKRLMEIEKRNEH